MKYPDLIVDLHNANTLRVTFPWHQQLIHLIKTIPGRRWNPGGKFWTIPARSLRLLQSSAARLGANVVVSEKVRLALSRGREQRAQLLQAKRAHEAVIDLPTETAVRPYQRAGVRFLLDAMKNFSGVLLADEMGLGKTLQALSIIALSSGLRKILVLCPASVKYVWADEIDKHYPQLDYKVIEGTAEERKKQWASPARIKIANYELLLHDPQVRVKDWDLVIADECTYAKNYTAKRTKALKKLHRRYSLGLSGAPIENRLEELHSIFDFVMPGLLGPGWLFVAEYCVKNYWGAIIGYKGLDRVKERIAPHYLRRTKDEVLPELPAKIHNDVWIEMSRAEWRLYEAIREQIREMIAENPKLKVANILTEMLRLKQCTGAAQTLGEDIESSKITALGEILEAAEGHKVVAFTQFAELAKLVAERFDAHLLHGGIPSSRRPGLIRAFQENGRQLLVSTEAGAYGITLTAADIVIHIDQPWNPARLRQREDRLHRIGQKSTVQVINLLARRTVDEYVRKILHRKRDLMRSIFTEGQEESSEPVTKSDLLALLGEEKP